MTRRVLAATLIASIAALHRPHPILSTDDAKQFRKQTGEAFARLMPQVVDAMLANSTAKADDLAAGDALLRKMNRGAQTVEEAIEMASAATQSEERHRLATDRPPLREYVGNF